MKADRKMKRIIESVFLSIEHDKQLFSEYLLATENAIEKIEERERSGLLREFEQQARDLEEEIEKHRRKERHEWDQLSAEERTARSEEMLAKVEDAWLDPESSHYPPPDADIDDPEYQYAETVDKIYSLHEADLYFDYRNILRSSFAVQVYSLFEVKLNQICECIQHESDCPIPVCMTKSTGIFRAADYIKAISGVSIREGEKVPSWMSLTDLNKVRNKIVHERGFCGKTTREGIDSLDYYQRNRTSITIDRRGQIILKREYCEQVVELLNQFFHEVGGLIMPWVEEKREDGVPAPSAI